MSIRDRTPVWLAVALLVAVCVLLFGHGLKRTALRGLYDDVDRAMIAREMADSNDWLAPTYHGKHLYTKPPLMYWVAGALYKLTGRHDELPAALASALSSLLVVLACFRIGLVLFGRTSALLAGLMLASSYLFLAMARQPLLDTVMTAGFALSMVALTQLAFAGTSRTTLWWIAMAIGMALAAMVKGPVVLPVLIIASVPLWMRRPRCLPDMRQLRLMLLAFAILVLPWHLILAVKDPNALAVWQRELFTRFGSGPPAYQWTQRPWWFYIPDLAHFLPWLALLPAALVYAFRQRRDRRFQFLLWWAVGGLVFFSFASGTKRSYYLLPLYPAFALLCGVVLDGARAVARRDPASRADAGFPHRLYTGGVYLLAVMVTFVGFLAMFVSFRFDLRPGWLFVLAGMISCGLGTWSIYLLHERRGTEVVVKIVAAVIVLLFVYVGHVVPAQNAYISGRSFYAEVERILQEPGEVAVFHVHRSLTAFYLDRPVKIWREKYNRKPAWRNRDWYLIADARQAHRIGGLQTLHLKTLRSPFGQTKELGLYRLPRLELPAEAEEI